MLGGGNRIFAGGCSLLLVGHAEERYPRPNTHPPQVGTSMNSIRRSCARNTVECYYISYKHRLQPNAPVQSAFSNAMHIHLLRSAYLQIIVSNCQIAAGLRKEYLPILVPDTVPFSPVRSRRPVRINLHSAAF